MTDWGTFRTQLRRSILKDTDPTPTKQTWQDAMLVDFTNWALDIFASHTAVATATSFDASADLVYTLPSHLYDGDDFYQTGVVYYKDSTHTPVYLQPSSSPDYLNPQKGEYSFTNRDVRLNVAPGSGYTLYVCYFAYYTHVASDTDLIGVPRWAEWALANLIGAAAMSGPSTQFSAINQWKTKSDSGTPETNSMIYQQNQFIALYERELARVARQDRANFWRKS